MVFWERKRPRSIRCFYCNKRSTLPQSASLRDWTCPLCEALNILDKDGTIADSIPPEYQQSISNFPSAPHTKQAELSTPFCSVCTSNQALLVKTLASYLPADNDPDIAIYERAFPAYKASLEERYPPVCTSCAPTIEARLQRNNYIAKSTALGNWLKGTKSSARPHVESTMLGKSFATFIWVLRGFLWWASSTVMLSWYAMGTATPATQKFGMVLSSEQQDLHSSSTILNLSQAIPQNYIWKLNQFIRWWFPVALLGTFWASKTLTTIWNPRTKMEGKPEYVKLQVMIQIMRATTIYALPAQTLSVEVYRRLSAVFLFVSLLHFICSLTMLTITNQARVDLRGTSSSLTDLSVNTNTNANQVSVTGPQAHTSLDHTVTHDFLPLSEDDDEDDERVDKEADSMDWQPQQDHSRLNGNSPFTDTTRTVTSAIPRMFPQPVFAQPREQYFSTNPAHRSPFRLPPSTTSEPMRLAKQKFFAPERPTGLENLFSAAVTLDDEPLLVRSIKSVQRTPTAAAWTSMVVTIALIVPLALGRFDIVAALGSIVTLVNAYLGLLPRGTFATVLLWPLIWAMTRATQHYNFQPQNVLMTSIHCFALAMQLGVQGWSLYSVLQKRKRQTNLHARSYKKRL